MLQRASDAATRSGALQAGRSCVSASPPQAPRQGLPSSERRLVAADAARNAGVHATAPGKRLAQHVAPMTSCRRRPSATRVRSVRAADWTLQRLPRLRVGPSRRHDRRVGPAPRRHSRAGGRQGPHRHAGRTPAGLRGTGSRAYGRAQSGSVPATSSWVPRLCFGLPARRQMPA
jgi:hypothetical protein